MRYDCLIVDDEKELATATCEYFELFGVSTVVAFDAKECLQILDRNQIKVILLDINLGNDSGFNLCKTIRERTDSGLGMYLSKLFMEGMGGGLTYYNEDGFVIEISICLV